MPSEFLQNQNNPMYKGDPEKNFIQGRDLIFPPTQQEILNKALEIEDEETKALYCLLYESGQRISEALKMKFGNLKEVSYNHHRFIEVTSITLKNRKQAMRVIPIPQFIPIEVQIFAYFNQIYQHRTGEIFMNQYSRNAVANKFRNITFNLEVLDFQKREKSMREVRLHPHLLRHFRLTHLVQLYHYSAFQLKQFAGWSSVLPATVYVNLESSDLANQFAQNFKFNKKS